MTTPFDAAKIIGRGGDPQGEGHGVHANVSYSFWGGDGAFTFEQQAAAELAMDAWEDVASINFFVDNEDPEIGFKNYNDPNDPDLGAADGPWEFNPDTTHQVGLNTANPDVKTLGYGQAGFETLVHEIGHAIGFDHPDEADGYDDARNSSLMHSSNTLGASTLMVDDIAAAQHFYGANMSTRTDNDVYGFGSTAGPAYNIESATDRVVFTIWDADGFDTLDVSDYKSNQIIDLRPGSYSNIGGLERNIAMADAVDIHGNNSWEAGFDPTRIANYVEQAFGGSGDDAITGNGADNVLIGYRGNDVLNGLTGSDLMEGGAGNDTYLIDSHGDQAIDLSLPEGGTDSILTSLNYFDLADTTTSENVENLYFYTNEHVTGRGNDANNVIHGGGGGDWLLGGKGEDELHGNDGADWLEGGSGDDKLFGGSGVDTLEGGAHNDTYYVDSYHDRIIENERENVRLEDDVIKWDAGGVDTVVATSADYKLGAHVENLTFAGGTGHIGTGNWLANEITGDSVMDILVGEGGADTLNGKAGNDILVGGADIDSFVFERGWGVDTIGDFEDGRERLDMRQIADLDPALLDKQLDAQGRTVVSFGGADKIILDGVALADVTADDFLFANPPTRSFHIALGDGQANLMPGTAGVDHLAGLGGDDTLEGSASADVLDGGEGTDTATYANSSEGVLVDLTTGNGTNGDADGDTLTSIENVIGSAHDDAIVGGANRGVYKGEAGDDILAGGSVYDELDGGAGDDWLVGTGGQTTMFGGAGNDALEGSLTSNNAMYAGTGNDVYTGGDWTDWMYDHEGGDDIMHGGGGNDSMVDFYGRNEMYGEGGDDFITSSSRDGSLMDGGTGDDTLFAYFGGNTLIGGDGNDRLEIVEGGAAPNTMTGGAGSDTFVLRFGVVDWQKQTVTDFQDGTDKILLWNHDYTGQTFADLTVTDGANGAVVSWYGNEMTFEGVQANQITADDFVYA